MMIKMPRLVPLKIKTRGKPWWRQAWIALTSPRNFVLATDFRFRMHSPDTGKAVNIVVPRGFKCDLASIPRLLWFVASPTGPLMLPGIVHDYAYRYARLRVVGRRDLPVTRQQADEYFHAISVRVNGCRVISFCAWLSLRAFGWYAWNAHRKNDGEDVQ